MTTTETSPPITLDVETARRLLHEAVEEKGADYCYPSRSQVCSYLDYDTDDVPTGPSCLIGHVLVKAGVPLSMLATLEGRNAEAAMISLWNLDVLTQPSGNVSIALMDAQRVQDSGGPWGAAENAFNRSLDHRAVR